MAQTIAVRLPAPPDPLTSRCFTILKDRIEQRCPASVIQADADVQIALAIDGNLQPDAFRIDQDDATVRVEGGSARGLLYGIGKLLRTSGYSSGYSPTDWRGTSTPHGSLRGMYFATHFHNWYHQASEPEIVRYIEDVALWGTNAIMAIFPTINLDGWDDLQAGQATTMLRQYAKATRDLGLQFATGVNNTLSKGTPDHLRAVRLPDPLGRRGNSGYPVCPSNPEGHAYIIDNNRRVFEMLADIGLDIVVYWPYDEGGCACERCAPWGSNGFVRLSHDLTDLGREYFPNLKTVLSTWMFDTPPEGEWTGLSDAMARDKSWVDYILADAHEDFPRYPLDIEVPGGLPLINFPEISMWGNWPWGGGGAHPLPLRYQRLWNQVKHLVQGGFPYSEGIYEDLNKAVVTQFYWERDRFALDTLREYIAYEFSPEVTAPVLAIIEIAEAAASQSFLKERVDADMVRRASDLADAVDARLPDWAKHNWRWEILRLRTMLDRERFAGDGLGTPEAEAALLRLMEIFHSEIETDDPYHGRVRPPLQRAVSRSGNL